MSQPFLPFVNPSDAASILGRMGAQARIAKERAPILERMEQLRRELKMPPAKLGIQRKRGMG